MTDAWKLTQLLAGPGKRAIGGAAFAAFSLWAEVCPAQADVPVDLSWEAPEGCSQQVEVEQQIRMLVGTLGEAHQVSRLRVTGSIEPFNERYRLTLVIERKSTHGTRVIESDDCQSLGKAAAVVLGLLVRREISSGRELTESDISGQPELSKPPEAAKPIAAPRQPEIPPQPPPVARLRSWRAIVQGPKVSVDLWTLPRASIGVGLGAGIAHGAWRAFVTGGLWKSQSSTFSGFQPFQADFHRWSLESWLCRGARLNPFEIAPCALLAFDDVTARASGGGRVPRARSAAWLSVGGGISGYWHIDHNLSLVISGSGRIMTIRPQFLVEGFAGEDLAHKVPLGTFVSSLGFEWIF